MRFIASVIAFMIIAHEVSGSHGGILVDGEVRDISRFVEYAKMNPYSVYVCPVEADALSEEAIKVVVRMMFEGREPYQFKHEARLLPMLEASITTDEIIPGNMEDVIRRLREANHRIRDKVRGASGVGLDHEDFFERSAVVSGVPEFELWRSLFITATDCAIYAIKELGSQSAFADEIGRMQPGLYEVRTMTEDLKKFVERSVMDERYKAIFRAW